MEREKFYQALFARAKEAGFSACEVYCESGSSFSVSVFGGEIIDYSASDDLGLGFRGLVNGRMGHAYTQALDEDAIELLVCGAKESAQLIECADEQFLFPGGEAYAPVECDTRQIEGMGAADKIALCRRLEETCAACDARIRREAEASVFSQTCEVEIVNSLGLRARRQAGLIGGSVQAVAAEGGRTCSGSGIFFGNALCEGDVERAARDAAKEALDGLDARSVPSGAYRVLFRNDVAAEFLRCFSGVFSADNAQKGLSLLAGREGEAVAAACVTIADEPHLAGMLTSTPFDGEGVPTRCKDVVAGGVLLTLLHNLKTAKKQGVRTTANAARAGYSSPVSVAASNLVVKPSALSREELLTLLGDGLFVCDLQGWHAGADPVSGDFSLPAKGYRVRDGKIVGAVDQITVAGNFFTVLKNIEAVGADLRFAFPSSSAFASPSLLVSALSVAGK